MALVLSTIRGYTDLSNSALLAASPAHAMHVAAISSNAVFGKVRTEIFQGFYVHGDTVPLPVSPIDKYVYSRSECMYFYNIAISTNKDSGWIQIGIGSLWFTNWFVDQNTGEVTSLQWYRNGGKGGSRTETNDGQIIVYTIAKRQRTTLLMATTPTYTAVSTAAIATDKPWTEALAQGLNSSAKFSVNNKEIIYCGEYIDSQQVSLSVLVSPDDGYHYSYAECKFLTFWRWTSASFAPALTQPPESEAFLGPWACSVSNVGVVTLYMERLDNDGHDIAVHDYGRVSVMAFCTRAGTPSSLALADSFAEISDDKFLPGNSLRASDVLQMKKNIDEAILTPEFFGPTEYADGQTIPLPTSPVDGYTYTRDEIHYVWSWTTCRPNTGDHVRVPIFYAGVDQNTGHVNMAAWRLTDHYVDDNNTFNRMTVVVVGRRANHPPAVVAGVPGNPPSDWPASDVLQPYGINYDMGGARKTPPTAGEILLIHTLPSTATGISKITFLTGLPGSHAGCRTPSSTGYEIQILLDGSIIGNIFFSGTFGSFAFPNDVIAAPGQTLSFVGGPADPTIVGIYWTMIGNRY